MRIDGDYPALTKLKSEAGEEWGEWRADGGQSVIFGVHPSGSQYEIQKEVQPISLNFDGIKWPET